MKCKYLLITANTLELSCDKNVMSIDVSLRTEKITKMVSMILLEWWFCVYVFQTIKDTAQGGNGEDSTMQ